MSQENTAPMIDQDTVQHAAHDTIGPDGKVRHQNEQFARPAVVAPEADATLARPEPKAPESFNGEAEVPLMPPPVALPKAPPQAAIEHVDNDNGSKAPLVVEEDVRARAEKELASYVGQKIDPALTNGLVLTLKENPNHGKDGIELCFQGPLLNTNSGLLGEQVIEALKHHPVFAPLFTHEQTAPQPMKLIEAGKEDMMHIHVNHLSAHQYSSIIHALSVPVVEAKHTQVLKDAAGSAVTPPAEVLAAEAPQKIIQTPVAALDKAVNDNEIAPQGVAL